MMMEVSVKSIKAVHKEDGVRKFLYENTIAIGNNDSPGRKSENRRKKSISIKWRKPINHIVGIYSPGGYSE